MQRSIFLCGSVGSNSTPDSGLNLVDTLWFHSTKETSVLNNCQIHYLATIWFHYDYGPLELLSLVPPLYYTIASYCHITITIHHIVPLDRIVSSYCAIININIILLLTSIIVINDNNINNIIMNNVIINNNIINDIFITIIIININITIIYYIIYYIHDIILY